MKRYLLTMVLGFVLSTALMAQKADQLKNSYNYLRAIEILENDGDPNEALDYLQKEVKEHPKNGYAYSLIGDLYLSNSQPGDAIEPINKAVPLLQKDKEWNTYVYRQRAKLNLRLGKDHEALNDWALAIKANPKDVDVYRDRAEYFYQKDQYVESDADYDRITKLEPGNTHGYMGKGRNAMETEKYQDAADLFSYCIRLDPDFSQPYAFRAESYFFLNRINEGLDDIIKALSIDENHRAFTLMQIVGEPDVNTLIAKLKVQSAKEPNKDKWPYYLGIVYEGIDNYLKAIESYKVCVKIEPTDVAYSRIAACYQELGDYELALDHINRAAEMDPDDANYVSVKADLLYDMGKGKEAVEAYDIFINADPEFWGGYYRRAYFKDNLQDVDGAIEDYSMAIALNPGFAYAYLGRGDKYLLKGQKEAAMKDYQMVVALDTVYSVSNCVQFALFGLGEIDRAKAVQDSILANSASPGNYYDAACLYARIGENENALNFLKQSFEAGFTRFAHVRNDDDLEEIRKMDGYKKLIDEYETKYLEDQEKKKMAEGGTQLERKEYVCEIPFTVEGGNCYVKCQINELPMRFVFDTGAADVSISMVEASFMMKNGYLTEKDVIGSGRFSDAIGNVSEGTVINLKKVKFGDLELDNVRASVVRNQKAPLLLGQTVLSRIGKIEIDNQKKVIVVKYMK